MSGERVETGTDVLLMDAVGAKAVRLERDGQDVGIGLVLDLEGRLNKTPERAHRRAMLSAGQAAELIAALVVAAQVAQRELGDDGVLFSAELEAAVAREQARLFPGGPPAEAQG